MACSCACNLCTLETIKCNLGSIPVWSTLYPVSVIPGLGRSMQEVFKALPYVVTIIVLIFTSFRKKKEHQRLPRWDFHISGKKDNKIRRLRLIPE